ncbi:MAG: hypothetical protein LBU67_05285 [Oscillospiraceae bacterium]|jgi:transcriptional regulator with XRE-family HTH domain|nr:hypothetical protein [Oscillospiraceae bacterium]
MPKMIETTGMWMRRVRENRGLTLAQMAALCQSSRRWPEHYLEDGTRIASAPWRCSPRLLEILEDGGTTTPAWRQDVLRAYKRVEGLAQPAAEGECPLKGKRQ